MGEVYLFTKSGASWATPAQALIQAADGQTKDAFGYSVAAGNGEVLVGAYQNGSTSPGAAYVFAGNGTSWSQQTKLVPSDGVNGDFFGYSVALSGNTALVGAYEKAMQTGAAYVFTSTGGAWAQTEVSAPAAGQSFGYSVALSGTVAAVGTTGNNSDMLYIYGLATSPPPPAPALGRRGNAAWLALGLAFVGAMLSRRSRGGA
jgi:hypothetical protein